MSTLKQTLVEYNNSVLKAKGTSNTSNLKKMFPGSPVYKQEISDAERLKTYQNFLDLDDVGSDSSQKDILGYYGFSGYSNNFDTNGAPDIENVKTGGGGLPATPYSPNPSSPGEGSTNASTQPAYDGEVKNIDSISNFGTGLGGLVSPSVTSKSLSRTKIGEYISGRSFAGSDGRS